MKAAIAWFARNRTAANLLMWFLLVAGGVALTRLHREEFPDINPRVVQVEIEYPGASPAEVEESLCMRAEEALDGTDGIEEMLSTAREGRCALSLELADDADEQQVLIEVKNRVDGIRHFPEQAEEPVVSRVIVHIPVVDLSVSGPADEASLKRIARRLRDELAQLPGITQVELHFARPDEISIEVSEEALRRHNLTFDEVASAVRRSSLDLPGGRLRTRDGEIRVRTRGQAYVREDFERLIVMTRPDGSEVRLDEVARVIDGFEQVDLRATADGQPALMVRVLRIGRQDALTIRERVARYLREDTSWIPPGIEVGIWLDHSEEIRLRLGSLVDNALLGLVLVLGVLALFLRFRLAFWVAAGLPVVFMGALLFFGPLGMSINTITVMSFLLALGIVVDDGIVVGENIHSHQQRGGDPVQAAIDGTQEVYVPVMFGVLTTVAAFLPLMLIGGGLAAMFGSAGAAVLGCLFLSLIEAQLILPAHLAAHGFSKTEETAAPGWRNLQRRTSAALAGFVRDRYGPWLGQVLEWRLVAAAGALGSLLVTAGLLVGDHLRYEFMPPVESDHVSASLEMPPGTTAEVTLERLARLERAAHELRDELDAAGHSGSVRRIFAALGAKPFTYMLGINFDASTALGAHVGEVTMALAPAAERAIGAHEIERRWRERAGAFPEADSLSFASDLFTAGAAIDVQLRGADLEALEHAAAAVRTHLSSYSGVVDLHDSFSAAQREVQLQLRPGARPLGLTLEDLGRQVRQAFHGEEVQRVQRGPEEVRVMVRYPDAQRRSLGDLDELRIRTADGAPVPLANVAEVIHERGLPAIQRADRKRVVHVTADVDRVLATPGQIMARLGTELPGLLARFPGVGFSFEGARQEDAEASAGLAGGLVLALLAIYALLAIPLRSYVQPLLIMSVIPFGVVGTVLGHLLLGRQLTFFSLLGLVALSGVVVNSSLMLVHRVNRERSAGLALTEALRRAAESRFRPILLTSLTTFAGLLPLMLERAVPLQMMVPMAISLAFGVLLSTVVTLVVVPCEYLLLEDLGRYLGRVRRNAARALPSASSSRERAA